MEIDNKSECATPRGSKPMDTIDEAEEVVTGLDQEAPKEEPVLTIISKEGERVTIKKKAIKLSDMWKTTLEHDPECKELTAEPVTKKTLESCIKYLEHWQEQKEEPKPIEKPLKSANLSDKITGIPEWDAEFINAHKHPIDDLYDVILAANYLGIKPLVELGCAAIASIVKNQPLDKLKEVLKPTQVPVNGNPAKDGKQEVTMDM